jgi:hypothetical protein
MASCSSLGCRVRLRERFLARVHNGWLDTRRNRTGEVYVDQSLGHGHFWSSLRKARRLLRSSVQVSVLLFPVDTQVCHVSTSSSAFACYALSLLVQRRAARLEVAGEEGVGHKSGMVIASAVDRDRLVGRRGGRWPSRARRRGSRWWSCYRPMCPPEPEKRS